MIVNLILGSLYIYIDNILRSGFSMLERITTIPLAIITIIAIVMTHS